MNTDIPGNRIDVKGSNTDWVATLTVLDLSGSITASQLRGLSTLLQSAWRRVRG